MIDRTTNAARGLGFARRAYVLRAAGLALGLIFVQMILWREQSSNTAKAYIAAYCVAWPHLAYALARRSPSAADAERRNMYVDDFVSGTSVAAMSFAWLPGILIVLMFMMNNVAAGGWRQLAKGSLLCLLGTLVGTIAFGARIEPRWIPDPTTLLACLPMLVVYPLCLGFTSYSTALKLAERSKALRTLSEHDALTGLLNRSTLNAHLERLLDRSSDSQRNRRRVLNVLFIDLDNFKLVNDSLGHQAGDELLRTIATRLQDATNPATEDIARYGGDEFVVVSVRSAADAVRLLSTKIIEAINEPVVLAGHTVHVHASVGVSTYPDHGTDPYALLSCADIAMYAAKSAGRNRVVYFDERLHAAAARRIELTTRLQTAQPDSAFTLHYQPQIALESGVIVGAQALIRWSDPALANGPPDELMPIAEVDGQIHAIGAWVIEAAIRQSRIWMDLGLPPTRISVNVSLAQIKDARFLTVIRQSLRAHAVPPKLLELALTESALTCDRDAARQTLERMKELGVSVAVDGFGTGYSSLASLQRFAIDRIRIDRRFVQAIGVTPRGEAVVDAVIMLVHALGIEALAEGVETEAQRACLMRHGCEAAQGYLFDRPLTAAIMEKRLRQRPLPQANASAMLQSAVERDEIGYQG